MFNQNTHAGKRTRHKRSRSGEFGKNPQPPRDTRQPKRTCQRIDWDAGSDPHGPRLCWLPCALYWDRPLSRNNLYQETDTKFNWNSLFQFNHSCVLFFYLPPPPPAVGLGEKIRTGSLSQSKHQSSDETRDQSLGGKTLLARDL